MNGNKLLDSFKNNIFSDLFMTLICQVTQINEKNINVKPLYKPLINGEYVELPILVNVPLMFLGNKKSVIKVELEVDDYVICLISDYDIDNLVISGKAEQVNTQSMHQINDAIAIPFGFTPFNNIEAHENKIEILKTGELRIGKETSEIKIDNTGNITATTTSKIFLGSENASEGIPLGDTLKSWIDTHTHDFNFNYSWSDAGGSSSGSGTTASPTSESPKTSDKVVVE